MTYTLYDVVVPRFKQTLSAMPGLIDKAMTFCEAKKVDPDTLANARLYPDMHPLHWQLAAVLLHTSVALDAVESGSFSPMQAGPKTLHDLKKALVEAGEKVSRITPDAINARENNDLVLAAGTVRIEFTVKNFLTTFSLPNHYFHASTAYGILRHNGVEIGKRDFLGQMQPK